MAAGVSRKVGSTVKRRSRSVFTAKQRGEMRDELCDLKIFRKALPLLEGVVTRHDPVRQSLAKSLAGLKLAHRLSLNRTRLDVLRAKDAAALASELLDAVGRMAPLTLSDFTDQGLLVRLRQDLGTFRETVEAWVALRGTGAGRPKQIPDTLPGGVGWALCQAGVTRLSTGAKGQWARITEIVYEAAHRQPPSDLPRKLSEAAPTIKRKFPDVEGWKTRH